MSKLGNDSKTLETKNALHKSLLRRKLARNNIPEFITYLNNRYQMKWFHRVMCDKLELVRQRKIKKLMLFVPPQHGKSEISSRNFPAYCLSKDPNEKIVIASYSATLAESFGQDIQRIIESDKFILLDNGIKLPSAREEGIKRADKFNVIGGTGYVKLVGRGGSLTGTTVDIGIIDDPLKDRKEAKSFTVREALWNWYTDVFSTRLHNESVQVIVLTRWDEDDLAGRLLIQDGYYSEENTNGWEVIKFPAIRENDINDYDPREAGEALFPEKHSLERLEQIKLNNKITFNSLYQQDPKPNKEALCIPNWSLCDAIPKDCQAVFRGLDFGFTNDPTALIKIGKRDNKLYLHEEIYSTGLTNPKINELCKGIGVKGEIFAESADPKSIEELKGLGLNVKPAIKGAGSIEAGISKLNEYDIYVTKTSVNLIRELKNYQWIMQGEKATNVPIDDYNHLIDATRYGVYTKYGQRAVEWKFL